MTTTAQLHDLGLVASIYAEILRDRAANTKRNPHDRALDTIAADEADLIAFGLAELAETRRDRG